MKKHHIHIGNGILLVVLLLIGAVSFFTFQGNKSAQIIIALVCGAVYALWGIVHHTIKKDLYPKVVVEYLLVSAIGVILMLMVLT